MAKRTAQFRIFRDAANEWRWSLVAGNGEIVAQSESYTRKRDATRSAKAVHAAVIDMVIAQLGQK